MNANRISQFFSLSLYLHIAGKTTTAEEVEEMLESGESAQIFTEGVSLQSNIYKR